jgi:hypothetical protein
MRHGRTEKGSVFAGELRMPTAEVDEMAALVRTVIVPEGIRLTINGSELPVPEPIGSTAASLTTEISDAEGVLRRTSRRTRVDFYTPRPNEEPTLYELGIPVCPSGMAWSADIRQKIPLTLDREAVPDSFLVTVRALALSALHERLTPTQARETWAAEALPKTSPEGVKAVLEGRYGEKRVIADPSDPEGTKLAVAAGYQVIQAGSFGKEEWAAIRGAQAALPAGRVTPSPKPFHIDGEPLTLIHPAEWSTAAARRAAFFQRLASEVLGIELTVMLTNDPDWGFRAVFSQRKALTVESTGTPLDGTRVGGEAMLTLNVAALGERWFALPQWDAEVVSLATHEFSHAKSSDHLSKEFHQACCDIGADITALAIERPHLFK